MKLSEAILLGSVGTTQGFGPDSIFRNEEGRCALGAALAAVGQECDLVDRVVKNPYNLIRKLWPWVNSRIAMPSILTRRHDGFLFDTVETIIWKLNDIVKMPRPEIAAWVATLENQLEMDPAPSEQHQEVTHG